MPSKKAVLACLLALSILAPACGSGVMTGPSAVTGGVWKVRSIEILAGGLVGIASPDRYTVEFKDAGKLAVKADCNVCGGNYSISGSSLQISALACTLAFCGAASNDVVFLGVLTSATTIGVRGIELSIDSPKGTLRLTQ